MWRSSLGCGKVQTSELCMHCTALQSSVPSDMVAGVSVRGNTWCVLLLNNMPPVQATFRPHATVQSDHYHGECLGTLDRVCTIAPQLRSQCLRGAGSGSETWNICIAEYMLGSLVLMTPDLQSLTSWQTGSNTCALWCLTLYMWLADDCSTNAVRHACVMSGAVSRTR